MNKNDLFKSMEAIDEELLARYADEPEQQTKSTDAESPRAGHEEHAADAGFRPDETQTAERSGKMVKTVAAIAGLAAAGILIAAGVRYFGRGAGGELRADTKGSAAAQAAENQTEAQRGVVIPPREVSLARSEADMIAFFIYEGRCYVQMSHVWPDPGLPDRHLGTITGAIDEWTPKDGYVDFAGSVTGEFYSVKGYDPEFLLCQKYSDGTVMLYVCNSGITLKKGADLYTDRLHLKGRFREVQGESRSSWFNSKNERFRADPEDEAVTRFIEALNEGTFISGEEVPSKDEWHMIFDEREKEHLYFEMEDGTEVQLRLLEGGYVFYQGILDACVQVPEDVMEDVIRLIKAGKAVPEEELPEESFRRTVEECREAPELGGYVPEYSPEGMEAAVCQVLYQLDIETARETGVSSVYLEYSDPEDIHVYYSIQVFWLSDFGENGYAGPLLAREDLTEDALKETMKTTDRNGKTMEYPWLDIAVSFDDAAVLLSARGLDAAECLSILESVR